MCEGGKGRIYKGGELKVSVEISVNNGWRRHERKLRNELGKGDGNGMKATDKVGKEEQGEGTDYSRIPNGEAAAQCGERPVYIARLSCIKLREGGRKEGCSEQLRSLISVCAVVTDPASRLALICSTDRVSQSSAGVVFGNGIPVVDVFG